MGLKVSRQNRLEGVARYMLVYCDNHTLFDLVIF